MVNMDDELVPHTSKVEIYSSTCSRCHWRGDKNAGTDYVRIVSERSTRLDGSKWVEVGKYPHRCLPCDSNRKRLSRMRKAVNDLDWWNRSLAKSSGLPKMYTVGLPSTIEDDRSLDEQILEIKLKWKLLRNHLLEKFPATWIGGISNIEATTRINFDHDQGPWFGIKYHVHIHAAVLIRFLPREALIRFSEIPLKFGLGRANIKGYTKDRSFKDYKWELSNYLAKYITKGNIRQRSVRFGIMSKRDRQKNSI